MIRQIMRDVEELQHQFGSAQNESLASNSRAREDTRPERRQDRDSAAAVAEALRMQTAFGAAAARRLLTRRGIAAEVAERALAGRRDQRQVPDRRLAARPAASFAQ
jgi:hypothetical protein